MLHKGIFLKNEKHLPEEKFLASLINMVLNDKSIEKIVNFQNLLKKALFFVKKTSDLSICRHLNNLQLSNNRIEKIENLENLKELRILRLENNFIAKLENLENLRNLEKL